MDGVVETPHGAIGIRVDGRPDAPTLLLCNALGTTLELWDAQRDVFAARFRTVCYDLRGHGRSLKMAPATSLADLGRDACAVLDAVGVQAAHVAGISLGGLVALWLAVNEPDRVNSLVLAHTAARFGSPERWKERIALVRTQGLGAVADRAIGTWFTAPFVARATTVAERYRRMVARCSPDGYCGCCEALRDADLRGDLGGVSAPTLVLAGARDQSATLEQARELVGGLADATLNVLDCAHLGNVECADEFTRETDAFLAAG